MARRLALVVSIALCALVLPGAAPPTLFTPGAPGVGDPYYPLDGNGGYDVRHYDLDLSYDPEADELSGTATIEARASQDLSAFNLDFVGLTVDSVEVDGAGAAWVREGQELTIAPIAGIKNKAAFTVVIAYHGVPETLQELGESGFLHTDDGAVIVGEPHGAATWFPANDHPTDKASFTFHWTVPEGLEAVANGVLEGQTTSDGWTTWTWDAVDPMATYLATVSIGELEIDQYKARGLPYWDAIDPVLFEPPVPPQPILPTDGQALLFSQVTSDESASYKRLTRVIEVPPGGATLSFDTFRDTEPGWDFLFVEARTAGEDWTTLEEQHGFTSQDIGSCPGFLFDNPFLEHYLTPVLIDPGDPENPDDDQYTCEPVGTSGEWWAASGDGFDWEGWEFALPNDGTDPIDLEISISYASDAFFQLRGVALDNLVVSTGQGSTSFEDDGDQFDGWVTADPPDGSGPNENTWIVVASVEPPPFPSVILPTDGADMMYSQRRRSLLQAADPRARCPARGLHACRSTRSTTPRAPSTSCSSRSGPPAARIGRHSRSRAGSRRKTSGRARTSSMPTRSLATTSRPSVDPGDPEDPDDDFFTCDPVGTSGEWWAASGEGFDWEGWEFALPNDSADPVQLEVSISYASDPGFQQRGVTLDNLVVSSGSGSTSFEDDGDQLDGWVVADAPEGSGPNENSWTPISDLQPPPGPGVDARASLARQPEIIDFLSDVFGSYPFRTRRRHRRQRLHRVCPGDADATGLLTGVLLRRPERRRGRPRAGPPVGRRLARGRALAAHLAERGICHLRGVDVGGARRVRDRAGDLRHLLQRDLPSREHRFLGPADRRSWDGAALRQPGLFPRRDDPARPALQVGDRDFFRILQGWAREQAGGNVTTDEFIALAEHVSHQQLDELFDTWLFSTTRPELSAAAVEAQRSIPKGKAKEHVRDAVRPMLERQKLGYKAGDNGKHLAKGKAGAQ